MAQQGSYPNLPVGAAAPPQQQQMSQPTYAQQPMQGQPMQQPQVVYQQQPQQVVYAQQPMQYVPQQQTGTTIVVVENGPQFGGVGFSRGPVAVQCPSCRANVNTSVSLQPGGTAWICCVVMLFVFWPCSCLPLCLPECQDVVHSCPSCGSIIARRDAQPC